MIKRVEVKQDHIDRGIIGSCRRCPVSLAVMEITRVIQEVRTSGVYLLLVPEAEGSQRNLILPAPPSVGYFVLRFDMNRPVEPFEFDLEIPDEFLRQ